MIPRKLKVLIATFPYGGNGASASEHPDIRNWLIETIPKIKADERVEQVAIATFNDTPITMTRNAAVAMARDEHFDVLLMIDSDQSPDMDVGHHAGEVPFWDAAFGFLYEHYDRGPVAIGSPYTGPPPNENVYVFRWRNPASNDPSEIHSLEQYTREEAFEMTGIQECAALPTGLIMFDVRLFELTEPEQDGDDSWFYYEYRDKYQSAKCSTEDVTATRDLAMIGQEILGYNPIHCAWSSWAGHWKPKCVGRPLLLTQDSIGKKYRRAATGRLSSTLKRGVVRSSIVDKIDWSKVARFEDLQESKRNGPPAPTPPELLPKHPPRMIAGREVTPLAHRTNDHDLKAIKALAQALPGDDHVLIAEIGSWVGESALAMIEGLGKRPATIYCIDTWQGNQAEDNTREAVDALGSQAVFDQFLANVAPYMEKNEALQTIVPIAVTSAEAAKLLKLHSFDLVFIDADHAAESCREDIQAWLPRVAPGGILCGHDYGCDLYPGVKQVVDEIFGKQAKAIPGTFVWYTQVAEEDHGRIGDQNTADASVS